MEIRVLRYFLMVAREENITKAASLLHITQPTLSRQMMQLEEELGVTLFHRSKSGPDHGCDPLRMCVWKSRLLLFRYYGPVIAGKWNRQF